MKICERCLFSVAAGQLTFLLDPGAFQDGGINVFLCIALGQESVVQKGYTSKTETEVVSDQFDDFFGVIPRHFGSKQATIVSLVYVNLRGGSGMPGNR
jgi:hypothetical protein